MGEWMIVKLKKRNNHTSNKGKDFSEDKTKANKGRKEKSHADRDADIFHATNVKPNKGVGDPAKSSKQSGQGTASTKSKNKRQIEDNKVLNRQFVPRMPMEKGTSPKVQQNVPTQPNKNNSQAVFHVGMGAKSTVWMKAVSETRYVLLDEEEQEQPSDGMEMNDSVAGNSQQKNGQ